MTNPASRLRQSRLAAPSLTLALCFGLWVSARYAVATWGAESDTALAVMLWRGVREHGPGFLRTFNYTPDNWLLFPLPAFSLVFAAGGTEPWIVVAIGWTIFLACVGVAFLIVRRTGGPMSAAAAAVVLLSSNRNATGEMGFLTYPITHNASLLAGLVALYATLRWLDDQHWRWLTLSTLLLVAASVSDPWTVATFVVPIACAATGTGLLSASRLSRRATLGVLLAVGLVVVAYRSALFGILDFVPTQNIRFGTVAEAIAGTRLLLVFCAMWFNFVPGADAAYMATPGAAMIGANLTLLLLGVTAAAAVAARQAGSRPAFDMLWLCGAASCALTVAAFVVLQAPKTPQSGRYFMATYLLLVMLGAASAGRGWGSMSRKARLAVIVYGALLPLSGVASGVPVWASLGLPVPAEPAASHAAFFQAHELRYGYGGYWGVQASGVTWVTEGAVTIRPVVYDPATRRFVPRRDQTSRLWYGPADRPAGETAAFLAMTAHADGCDEIAVCVAAAETQFGPAQSRLENGATTVLVYDYGLFGVGPDVLASHASPLPTGVDIDLRAGGASPFGRGWAQPEPTGTWTEGIADILLRLPPGWNQDTRITVAASAFVPPGARAQPVEVWLRGRLLGRWQATAEPDRRYSVIVSAELLGEGGAALTFAIPGATSPRAVGLGADTRILGLHVRSIRLDDVPR